MQEREWPTMDVAEIAAILGIKRDTFSRKKKNLIAREGMPAPLPGGRYSRAAIMRWLETYGRQPAAEKRPQESAGIASLRILHDRAALEARYVAGNRP